MLEETSLLGACFENKVLRSNATICLDLQLTFVEGGLGSEEESNSFEEGDDNDVEDRQLL
jgi:hypothetical protein